MNYEENIIRAIAYMENHLTKEISLEAIASQAYYSSFHFHRLFSAVTKETPGSYLRKRRLSQASHEILQSNKRILDIALDYQFQSQESFSRAFKKFLGVTPGQYRRSGLAQRTHFPKLTLDNLNHRYQGGISVEPEFKKMSAMKFIGMICSIDSQELPKLWETFIAQRNSITNLKNNICYSLCFHIEDNCTANSFLYMPCAEVNNIDNIPISMVAKTVPENEYAVFTHKGSLDKIKDTYEYIYGTWLSKSSYSSAGLYDFGMYNDDFSIENPEESRVYIHIPVAKET
ncbi:GyrI-like domain-containing protein [Candidatus Uabimicrobium sp. HlEnr_7]|uniref:GyrI-like domain-containing protein n=1 Tax=Candidatus Uabimicrobium helgolandensis TaxID=3095367 RepID=UPI0035563ED3